MAKIPEVAEKVEDNDFEFDLRGLDDILYSYNYSMIPRIELTPFRTRYLPNLVRTDLRDIDITAVRMQWIEEVAKRSQCPVFVVADGDESKVLYRVPPFIGTVTSSLTGHERSMATLTQFEKSQKMRLNTLGAKAAEMKFNVFSHPSSDVNRVYQLDWIRIMLDFGYLHELHTFLGDGPYPDDVAAIVGNKLDKLPPKSDKPQAGVGPEVTTPPTAVTIGVEEEELYDDE